MKRRGKDDKNKQTSSKENKKMLVYATVENAVKLVAYKLGKIHKIIPVPLKRKLSAYMK